MANLSVTKFMEVSHKGMKRKGGIAWLPEFLVGASETPEQVFWSKVNLRDLVIYDIGAFQGLLTLSKPLRTI